MSVYAQIIGDREVQEDYFASFLLDAGELVLLADGMGGEEGGEVASSSVVKEAIRVLKSCENEAPLCFEQALFDAQTFLKELIDKEPNLSEMGTTLILAFIKEDTITWLSIGDSPLYRIRNNIIIRLNANHSIGGVLDQQYKNGTISKEEAKQHPQRHYLTSLVSRYDIEKYELRTLVSQREDIYIIASDGIETLSEREILELCNKRVSPQQKADDMIKQIILTNKSNQDNTTIVLVEGDKR